MFGKKTEEEFRRRFGIGDGSGSEGEGGLLKLFVNPEGERGAGDGDGSVDERLEGVDGMFARFKATDDVMTDEGLKGNVIKVDDITGDAIAGDVTA